MSLGSKSKSQAEKLRKPVYKRDHHECVACGYAWTSGRMPVDQLSIQHRVGRGMGGSALYDKTASSLITFCIWHNVQETADADFHKLCLHNGWSVPRWVPERRWPMESVPVRYVDGWFFLVGLERVGVKRGVAEERMVEIYGPDFLG